jgi:hypothetical protein
MGEDPTVLTAVWKEAAGSLKCKMICAIKISGNMTTMPVAKKTAFEIGNAFQEMFRSTDVLTQIRAGRLATGCRFYINGCVSNFLHRRPQPSRSCMRPVKQLIEYAL